jgi:hypothetical protein
VWKTDLPDWQTKGETDCKSNVHFDFVGREILSKNIKGIGSSYFSKMAWKNCKKKKKKKKKKIKKKKKKKKIIFLKN